MTCSRGPPCRPGNTALSKIRAASGPAEDSAAPRTGQRLVGGGGDPLAVGKGEGCTPAGHQPGDVGHVDHQFRAHLVGDRPEGGEVDDARIGARADDDQLGPVLQSLRPHFVDVDAARLPGHPVVDERVAPAGEVDRQTVSEVTAVGQAHGQHDVARLEQSRNRRLGWPWSRSAAARWRARLRRVPWPARWPATRPRPRLRIRRSSGSPDSPRRTCW